jgi:hypothetical protein
MVCGAANTYLHNNVIHLNCKYQWIFGGFVLFQSALHLFWGVSRVNYGALLGCRYYVIQRPRDRRALDLWPLFDGQINKYSLPQPHFHTCAQTGRSIRAVRVPLASLMNAERAIIKLCALETHESNYWMIWYAWLSIISNKIWPTMISLVLSTGTYSKSN